MCRYSLNVKLSITTLIEKTSLKNLMVSGHSFFWTFGLLLVSLNSCEFRRKQHPNVFYYNEPTGIASLDPAFAKNQSIIWAVNQIYNGLVAVDPEMRTIPCLAKYWDISDDRKIYRFHLRTDVYFHDDPVFPGGKGRKLNASDIAFSFHRLIDPLTASPGAWVFNDRVDKEVPFTVVDDSTFDLRLARPFSPILGVLSAKYCSVVPREAVQFYGKDFRRHPCGRLDARARHTRVRGGPCCIPSPFPGDRSSATGGIRQGLRRPSCPPRPGSPR